MGDCALLKSLIGALSDLLGKYCNKKAPLKDNEEEDGRIVICH